MVIETRHEYPTESAAIATIAPALGIGTAQTLRNWVRAAEVGRSFCTDAESSPSAADVPEVARLRQENAELRRALEILRAAGPFLAAELDRPQRL